MAEYTLTNEEKNNIIITHLRTLAFQKYNLEVSIMEEQSTLNPNEDNLSSYNAQIAVIDNKIARLEAESNVLVPAV
jgi:hypothetical protein